MDIGGTMGASREEATMLTTKALILAEVLKQERPFKAQKIHNNLGLDRSLVHHHLKNLVSSGGLEKNGVYYAVADRDALINVIAELSDGPSVRLVQDTELLGKNAEKLNNLVRAVAAFRNLEMPYAQDVKRHVNDEIDEAIKQLKVARKFLNEKSYTKQRAINTLIELGLKADMVHDMSVFGLRPIVGKTEFMEAWQKRMDEVDVD